MNGVVQFFFSVLHRKYPFLGNLGSKIQNCQFKLKPGTKTNSNMQNSMGIFSFSVFHRKYPFWANLVCKIKITRLHWNSIPRLNRICTTTVYLICFRRKVPFWRKFGPKNLNCQFMLKFGLKLISICLIQWGCSLFLVLMLNTYFRHIWSKNSKLFVQSEIWYLD